MLTVLLAALGGVFFHGSQAIAETPDAPLQRFESVQPQMGVPFKILLYAPDESTANQAFEAAFSHIKALNQILSDYDPDSELSRLSQSSPAEQGVPVSPDLWTVLARSQQLAVQTDGAFDMTVGPFVRLWRRAKREKQLPTPARVAEARASVGYQAVRLDEARHTARLLKPHMKLDLGGIAMGYAVDETVRLLRARGLTRVLVDASGDIAVGDPPPGKAGWSIGVIPLAADGTPSKWITLANAAVTTSGDAFQYVTIDGKRYSHIVDPRTGLGMTDRTSVGVIAPDCFTADGLDTAVCVLGPTAGLKLVEETPGCAAFVVRATDTEPEVFESSRFSTFVTPTQPSP